MSGRPINLPDFDSDWPGWMTDNPNTGDLVAFVHQYALDAVEADRQGIVVTDEDVVRAYGHAQATLGTGGDSVSAYAAALESYAARLRGETP